MQFLKRSSIAFKYHEREIKIPIQYSKRKTLTIEIKPELTVVIKAPTGIPFSTIKQLVDHRTDWITKKLEEYEAAGPRVSDTISESEKKKYRSLARKQITSYVEHYAAKMNVSYGRIAIREQKTCWGSCSSKKNLNFNWKLVLMPKEIMEYVVVHELAHLFEMNHSSAFWAIVENVLPDYRQRRSWLHKNGKNY